MSSKSYLFIQLIIVLILSEKLESVDSHCDNSTNNGNGTNNGNSILLITFGCGPEQYSNKKPSSFNFTTAHQQKFGSDVSDGHFALANRIPHPYDAWHQISQDHTPNDTSGYLFILNVAKEKKSKLFESTVDGLHTGQCYEFSAYLANIVKKGYDRSKPNVRFEVRANPGQKNLIAQTITGGIPDYDNMTWSKYGLSFIASSSSVILRMLSHIKGSRGNDLAIDDIELRVCPTIEYDFCPSEAAGLYYDKNATNGKSFLLITFGYGSEQYSNKTPSSFNFSTIHNQTYESLPDTGMFGFVNAIPPNMDYWHNGTWDHTPNDTDGYMFILNVAKKKNSKLFESTVDGLCIGQCYEFSAYLANIVKKEYNRPKPNVRFEVRANTSQNDLLAQTITGGIPHYDKMTWSKYGLSFIASNSSVVLLMWPHIKGGSGNDLAIDDIELRVCSTVESDFCPSDITSMNTSTLGTATGTQISINGTKLPFNPELCDDSTYIGDICNISSTSCELMNPCENNGTCFDDESAIEYTCLCPPGVDGDRCEFDHRNCASHICLNNGTCNETSDAPFYCTCADGWQGAHCEIMEHGCDNSPCMNNGVCRPILLGYKCECLGDSYYGPRCEKTATKTIVYQMVSKSFGYVAILAIVIVALFVVIMDILKYGFGIDPIREDMQRYRREKQARKRKRPVIQRVVCVISLPEPPKKTIATNKTATV